MARKRKRNRHRKKRRHMQAKAVELLVNDSFKHANHKEFIKDIEKKELSLLNRSIFVTNVKNLNNATNLALLKHFFEANYGKIESCQITTFKKKKTNHSSNYAPPAKIVFRMANSATKIFGKSLEEARRDRAQKLIHASIAHNGRRNPGYLRVMPTTGSVTHHARLSSILHNDQDELSKKIRVKSLSLGHWVPDDALVELFPEEVASALDQHTPEFVEEFKGFYDSDLVIDLRRRSITVVTKILQNPLDLSFLLAEKYFEIVIRLKQINSKIMVTMDSDQGCSLLFNCIDPPKLYQVVQSTLDESETRTRLTSMYSAPFGHCHGFRLSLPEDEISMFMEAHRNDRFSKNLWDFGLIDNNIFRGSDDLNIISIKAITYCEKSKENLESYLNMIPNRKIEFLTRSILESGKCFSWYDALYNRVETEGNSLNFFELLSSYNNDVQIQRNVLESIQSLPRCTRFPTQILQQMLFDQGIEDSTTNFPEYCIELPRLLVTPTKCVISGFDLEMSNRVVRHFINEGNAAVDFMRVTFCDENGEKMFSDDFKASQISERIKNLILSGVTIGKCRYKFLAYSSSQLKECSIWMVNSQKNENIVEDIRSWMGDFSSIRVPSKFAARMGQCFSTTVQTLTGNSESSGLIKWIFGSRENELRINDNTPDVNSNSGSCHSDGTGLIRRGILLDVVKKIPFITQEEIEHTSIIQIRFGGAKGTLTAWENLPKLRNYDVCLRGSMIKFPSQYRHLEVIKTGKHIPYFLNRQVIMLLSTHKIQATELLNMQSKMLDDLDAILFNRDMTMGLLPQLGAPNSHVLSSVMHMLSSGLTPKFDPFVFSCVHAIRNHHLTNLRKKSRIFVEKGGVFIGGMDESTKIKEGCVFVQVRKKSFTDKYSFQPLVGPVLVTKHPVTHPGDVRMLLAVDIPELRGHKNVILFSQYGERSEPDKMSGSDLDGDEFAVTWDERLFLSDWNCCKHLGGNSYKLKNGKAVKLTTHNLHELHKVNCPPMQFDTQAQAAEVPRVTDEHLVNHFLNFAKADTLGRISMLWLDHAAKNKSASCNDCLRLAELHSIAVDFPKSGTPAQIPKELLLPSYEPRPHWREKKGSDVYHCKSAVGQLYDDILSRGSISKVRDHTALAGRKFNKHGQLICIRSKGTCNTNNMYKTEVVEKLGLLDAMGSNNEELKKETVETILFAEEQRDNYEDDIMSMMNKYKIHSEGEILTGCISKFHKLHKRKQHKLAEEVRYQCRELYKSYRRDFLKEILLQVKSLDLDDDGIDENTEEIYIQWVEMAVSEPLKNLEYRFTTFSSKMREIGSNIFFDFTDMMSIRSYAQKVASAYYLVTFNRNNNDIGDTDNVAQNNHLDLVLMNYVQVEERKNYGNDRHALFSFPHIIFDVIDIGLNERITTS